MVSSINSIAEIFYHRWLDWDTGMDSGSGPNFRGLEFQFRDPEFGMGTVISIRVRVGSGFTDSAQDWWPFDKWRCQSVSLANESFEWVFFTRLKDEAVCLQFTSLRSTSLNFSREWEISRSLAYFASDLPSLIMEGLCSFIVLEIKLCIGILFFYPNVCCFLCCRFPTVAIMDFVGTSSSALVSRGRILFRAFSN